MSEKCPKCGSQKNFKLPIKCYVEFECGSHLFKHNNAFVQTPACKTITTTEAKLAKAISALRQIALDEKEWCYHARFASTTLAELNEM
jgi:hypothetical protein